MEDNERDDLPEIPEELKAMCADFYCDEHKPLFGSMNELARRMTHGSDETERRFVKSYLLSLVAADLDDEQLYKIWRRAGGAIQFARLDDGKLREGSVRNFLAELAQAIGS